MDRWHRSFLAGFAACAIGLHAASRGLRRLQESVILQDVAIGKGMASIAARHPGAARARHLFWAFRRGRDVGVALRVLETRELFEDLFPGYGEARSDAALWERYFSAEIAGQALYSPTLSLRDLDFIVITSWLGSLELFRRYGADVALIGNSEVLAGIDGRLLAEASGTPNLKVLHIGHAGMMPATARREAAVMGTSGRRTRVVVWGYSLWNSYVGEHAAEVIRHADGALNRAAPPPAARAWRRVFPRGFDWGDWILQDRASVLKPLRNRRGPMVGRVGGWEVRQRAGQAGFTFPLSALSRPRVLEDMAALARPRYHGLAGMTPADCRLDGASRDLDAALAELLKLSDRVVLYLTPTTPLLGRAAPSCLRPAVVDMLRSKAGPRVLVETADWSGYGLGYEDFVFPNPKGGWANLDVNHVNFSGSLKVTAAIARMVREALARH